MTSVNFTSTKLFKKVSQGFTLIELLIVIAVLGILAAVVLAAINPAEQLARGADSNRLQLVSQVGNSTQNYVTAVGSVGGGSFANALSTLSVAGANFMSILTASSDIQQVESLPSSTAAVYSACNPAVWTGSASDNNICFVPNGTGFDIVTGVTSNADNLASNGGTACPDTNAGGWPFAVYDSVQGKAGLACLKTAAGNAFPTSANLTLH